MSLYHDIKSNTNEAIEELYRDVYSNVRIYVLQNSGNEDESKDIFQEAMVILWQKVQYGEIDDHGDAQLKSLLYMISKRRWLDHLRSSRYKHERATHPLQNDERLEVTESDQLTSEEIRRRWEIFERLDTRCQEILKDFYLRGRGIDLIAEQWKMSYDTMKTTKYRCLEKAKKLSRRKNG